MALLEPVRGKATMLPVIRAKESARAVGAGLGGAAAAAPAQTFGTRHRSVDPRTSALMTQYLNKPTIKFFNFTQDSIVSTATRANNEFVLHVTEGWLSAGKHQG